MKPRQFDACDFEDTVSRDFLDDAPPSDTSLQPRVREVCITEGRPYWTQHFSTHTPMVVLIHNGMIKVCRNDRGFVAKAGDMIFLTPGLFELHAIPSMSGGIINFQYAKFPLSVVAKITRDCGNIESVALRPAEDPGVFVQRGTLHQVLSNIEARRSEMKLMETVMMTLIHNFTPSVFPFLRSVYFNTRWAFLSMMESHALRPTAVAELSKRYLRGRAAFFADCELYTGRTPMKWFRERRMELADSWLHVAQKPVWEVAAALQYKGVRKFRTEYRKHFHRHPEEPRDTFGFGDVFDIESPFCCLRPFWWPYPLPLGRHDPWGIEGARFAALATPPENLVVPIDEPGIQSPESKPENPNAEECANQSAAARHPHLQPSDPREEESKSLIARFKDLEPIPIAELLPVPTDFPALLKAA